MTDEQTVERALDWMMENVNRLAQAWATAHDDYSELLDGLKVAVQEEAELKNLFTIAEAKIEVWRTIQANSRAGV